MCVMLDVSIKKVKHVKPAGQVFPGLPHNTSQLLCQFVGHRSLAGASFWRFCSYLVCLKHAVV